MGRVGGRLGQAGEESDFAQYAISLRLAGTGRGLGSGLNGLLSCACRTMPTGAAAQALPLLSFSANRFVSSIHSGMQIS